MCVSITHPAWAVWLALSRAKAVLLPSVRLNQTKGQVYCKGFIYQGGHHYAIALLPPLY